VHALLHRRNVENRNVSIDLPTGTAKVKCCLPGK
jgi:hypothetical protein